MSKFKINRRQFLGTSALAGLGASASIGFSGTAAAGASVKTLVYIFLRGGMDGLSLIVPNSGADLGHYLDARVDTAIDPEGSDPALDLDGLFGLHPFCGDLYNIRDNLAIIHAAGHPPGTRTRSHFDAQEQIELGTPGQQSAINGWLARYLAGSPYVQPGAVFSALVSSSNPPVSLSGYSDVATLDSAGSFHPNSGTYANTHLEMLQLMYGGNSELDAAARATLDAIDLVNSLDLDNYTPAGGVVYEDNSIADDLRLIAQLIREDLGVAVATMDVGGWDNHTNQRVLNPNNGYGRRISLIGKPPGFAGETFAV